MAKNTVRSSFNPAGSPLGKINVKRNRAIARRRNWAGGAQIDNPAALKKDSPLGKKWAEEKLRRSAKKRPSPAQTSIVASTAPRKKKDEEKFGGGLGLIKG